MFFRKADDGNHVCAAVHAMAALLAEMAPIINAAFEAASDSQL